MTAFEIAERNKGMKSVEAYYGNETFTWNGGQYLGVLSTIKDTITPEIGTLTVETFLQISARLEQWQDENNIPKGQDFITLDSTGKRYQVLAVERDRPPIQLVLTCVEDSRGVKG